MKSNKNKIITTRMDIINLGAGWFMAYNDEINNRIDN